MANGRPTPPGGTGTVRVRDAMVSAAAADANGWLPTRDHGRLDEDSFLWLEGRRDELVVTGGEHVAAAEVEAVLRAPPGVVECAVVGLPDPGLGRTVAAAVAPRDPARPLSPQEFAAWCRARLVGFKVPRHWVFVSELPRNGAGKARRNVVRRIFGGSGRY